MTRRASNPAPRASRRKRLWRGSLAGILAACALTLTGAPALAGPASGAAGVSLLYAGAPAGFDMLMRPQSALVDIYFGGVRVGSTLAEYRPGHIRFTNPDELVAMIPKLARAREVRSTLDEDLPTNADRVCAEQASGRCHRLDPATLGVIFDEASFRAEVFVNPAYLAVDEPLVSRYLPSPTAGPSIAASLSGQLAGSQRTGADYDLQARVTAAYRNVHLLAEVSQSSEVGTQIETLALGADRGRFRVKAGLMLSPGVDLVGEGRFYGASIGTQTDTLANRDRISANPILLYLPDKAQVDIFRAGRLLSSRQYGAGNQLIDTGALPEGVYAITLVIHEAGGFTRQETRAFSKNSSLPPLGMPQYFLAGGVLTPDFAIGLPRPSGGFLEAGYARRLSPQAAIDLTAAFVRDRGLAEVGLNYASVGGLTLRAAAMASSAGGVGLVVSSSFNVGRSSALTVDLRQGWGDFNARSAGDLAGEDTGSLTTRERAWRGLNEDTFAPEMAGGTISASYSTAWLGGRFGLTGAYHTDPFSKTSYAFGPSIDVPFKIRGVDLRFSANVTDTERGLESFFGFHVMLSRGHTSVVGDAGMSSMGDSRHSLQPAVDAAVTAQRAGTPWGDATGMMGFAHASGEDTLTAGGQLRGAAGDLTAQVDHDFSHGGDSRYNAGFMIGAVLTPSQMGMSEPSGGDSGVLIKIEGPARGLEFNVLVNDTARAVVRAGQDLSLMLPAYRVYTVRLTPVSADPVDFDTNSRQVSLYPGNVQVLTWKAQRIVEVFGRAVDEDNLPIAEAVIKGALHPGLTDENGYFQVEVASGGTLSFERANQDHCSIDVIPVSMRADHASIGARHCLSAIVAARAEPNRLSLTRLQEAGFHAGSTSLQAAIQDRPVIHLMRASPDPRHRAATRLGRLEPEPAHRGSLRRSVGAWRRGTAQYWRRASLRRRHSVPGRGRWKANRA